MTFITMGYMGRSVHEASVSPTTRDLEWAAGLMEGEASFKNYNQCETIDVTQVNPDPLGRLLALFGGRVMLRHTKQAQKSDYWTWRVSGARARGIMMTLYPLLSAVRQDQISMALAGSKAI